MSEGLFEGPDSLFGFNGASNEGDRNAALAAAREELRRRLPELRKLPGCPTGSDDDIIAMSYPPYYTACPNPFIADWLNALERPSDEGRVDPGPFASDVSVGKGNAFYKAHSYPTKVPHPAIMRFILHYTKPGDVVLDGFAGTGMTGVAAQACGSPDPETKAKIEAELGKDNVVWGTRRAILGALGPSATFISAGLNLPVDAKRFDAASEQMLERFEREYGWMYKTSVTPAKGKAFEADIDYTIWSEVFTCPHCGGEVIFYDAAFIPQTGRVRDEFPCPSCGAQLTKDGLERRRVKDRTLAGDIVERIEFRPVRIAWRSGTSKGEKLFDERDESVLDRVRRLAVSGFPSADLPLGEMVHGSRLGPKGFKRTHHLWPDRALASLTAVWAWSRDEKDALTGLALRFWLEQALQGMSWLNVYKAIQFGKVGGSQVNRFQTGFYYIPSLVSECSLRYNLSGSMPSRGKAPDQNYLALARVNVI